MTSQTSRVLLAEPRGFCAGVEMAIKALTWMVRVFEPPVYCFHEIVHNAWVVTAFEKVGVVFVDNIGDVPIGAPVMLSAHGSSPEVVAGASERAAVVIDAVCPLVTKVHHEVKRMADQSFDIIYVGHDGHDEAVGTVAEAPDAITLVEPEWGLEGFEPKDPAKVALVAQTTLGMYEWNSVLEDAQGAFPDLWTARKSDLCYATTNRQKAVQEMASHVGSLMVIGSENSSNTRALVRVAHEAGIAAHRIDRASDIEPAWLTDVVGVTAGASAPDHLVQQVIEAIAPTEGFEVFRMTEETEYFPLPPQLRAFLTTLQTLVEAAYTARVRGRDGLLQNDKDWTATEALSSLTDTPL